MLQSLIYLRRALVVFLIGFIVYIQFQPPISDWVTGGIYNFLAIIAIVVLLLVVTVLIDHVDNRVVSPELRNKKAWFGLGIIIVIALIYLFFLV